MQPANDRQEIAEWLSGFGYNPDQIQKILTRLHQYDARITRESLFDAIGNGEVDLDSFVKDALNDPEV